ncbi:hypothetical protein I3842_11G111200 [Carya illinoinensis]|uniref:Uncharacterized protein n=1 Tax=Carya illinoinensis TaxID=32201 RepID=A0A922IZH4_CARIL|nr:hypothetical protein I3842_11G111200 [Carya illinoinensis]
MAEWVRTSLGKSVRIFKSSFLQPLLKVCQGYKLQREIVEAALRDDNCKDVKLEDQK